MIACVDNFWQSEVGAHEFYAAMRIKTHLDNTLYLSSLWSDLSCVAELVIPGTPGGFLRQFDLEEIM